MINIDTYRAKIVIAGNVIEVYHYQEDIAHNFKKFDCTDKKIPPENFQEEDEESEEEIKKRSLQRSKIRLRRLVNANNKELNKFITLTYRENITDISKTNKDFEKFKKRLKYNLKKENKTLKYIVVLQFQKRGAIHYHCLMNCGYIPNKKLNRIWRHGFVKINNIDNIDNVGAYVVSYMSNDFKNIEHKNRYLHSHNLKKPVVIKNDSKVAELLNDLKDEHLAYETEYDTEYFGKVNYKQYKT